MLRSFKSCDSTTINSTGPREGSSATRFSYRKFQWVGTLSPVPFHPHWAPRSCTWRARISCKIFSRVAFLHPFSVWRCCKSWTCTGIASSTSLFLGTKHNSGLFRFSPSLPISSQVPSRQAGEIRSIWRVSPRTETSRLDLFPQSLDYFPNRMFCPGFSIIRPDRFPETSLFVMSCKFSICKEIKCRVASPHLLGLSGIFNFWTRVGTNRPETSLLSSEIV